MRGYLIVLLPQFRENGVSDLGTFVTPPVVPPAPVSIIPRSNGPALPRPQNAPAFSIDSPEMDTAHFLSHEHDLLSIHQTADTQYCVLGPMRQ